MGLLKRRIKENQSNQKDITTILENTICELKVYLKDLEDGKVHDISKFTFASSQYYNATKLLSREIDSVLLSIKTLQSTLDKIKSNKIADTTFHYDTSHYDEV